MTCWYPGYRGHYRPRPSVWSRLYWKNTARKSCVGRREHIDGLPETELLEKHEMFYNRSEPGYDYQQYRQPPAYDQHPASYHQRYSPPQRNRVHRHNQFYENKENKNDPQSLNYYLTERRERDRERDYDRFRSNDDRRRRSRSPGRKQNPGKRRWEEHGRRRSQQRVHSRSPNSPRSFRSRSPGHGSSNSPRRTHSRSPSRSRSSKRRRKSKERDKRKRSRSSTRSDSTSRNSGDYANISGGTQRKVKNRSPERNVPDEQNHKKRVTSVVKKLDKNQDERNDFPDSKRTSKHPMQLMSRKIRREDSIAVEMSIGELSMSPISSEDFSQRSEEAESDGQIDEDDNSKTTNKKRDEKEENGCSSPTLKQEINMNANEFEKAKVKNQIPSNGVKGTDSHSDIRYSLKTNVVKESEIDSFGSATSLNFKTSKDEINNSTEPVRTIENEHIDESQACEKFKSTETKSSNNGPTIEHNSLMKEKAPLSDPEQGKGSFEKLESTLIKTQRVDRVMISKIMSLIGNEAKTNCNTKTDFANCQQNTDKESNACEKAEKHTHTVDNIKGNEHKEKENNSKREKCRDAVEAELQEVEEPNINKPNNKTECNARDNLPTTEILKDEDPMNDIKEKNVSHETVDSSKNRHVKHVADDQKEDRDKLKQTKFKEKIKDRREKATSKANSKKQDEHSNCGTISITDSAQSQSDVVNVRQAKKFNADNESVVTSEKHKHSSYITKHEKPQGIATEKIKNRREKAPSKANCKKQDEHSNCGTISMTDSAQSRSDVVNFRQTRKVNADNESVVTSENHKHSYENETLQGIATDLNQSRSHTLSLKEKKKGFEAYIKSKGKNESNEQSEVRKNEHSLKDKPTNVTSCGEKTEKKLATSNDSSEKKSSSRASCSINVVPIHVRERKLSGAKETSQIPRERKLSGIMDEPQIRRERKRSGAVDIPHITKERRLSGTVEANSTPRPYQGSDSSPAIVKGKMNRPSGDLFIPLGRPPEKKMKFSPSSQSAVRTDSSSQKSNNKEMTGHVDLEEGRTSVSELKNKFEERDDTLANVTTDKSLGGNHQFEPKMTLFGKNQKRISRYSKDQKSSFERSQQIPKGSTVASANPKKTQQNKMSVNKEESKKKTITSDKEITDESSGTTVVNGSHDDQVHLTDVTVRLSPIDNIFEKIQPSEKYVEQTHNGQAIKISVKRPPAKLTIKINHEKEKKYSGIEKAEEIDVKVKKTLNEDKNEIRNIVDERNRLNVTLEKSPQTSDEKQRGSTNINKYESSKRPKHKIQKHINETDSNPADKNRSRSKKCKPVADLSSAANAEESQERNHCEQDVSSYRTEGISVDKSNTLTPTSELDNLPSTEKSGQYVSGNVKSNVKSSNNSGPQDPIEKINFGTKSDVMNNSKQSSDPVSEQKSMESNIANEVEKNKIVQFETTSPQSKKRELRQNENSYLKTSIVNEKPGTREQNDDSFCEEKKKETYDNTKNVPEDTLVSNSDLFSKAEKEFGIETDETSETNSAAEKNVKEIKDYDDEFDVGDIEPIEMIGHAFINDVRHDSNINILDSCIESAKDDNTRMKYCDDVVIVPKTHTSKKEVDYETAYGKENKQMTMKTKITPRKKFSSKLESLGRLIEDENEKDVEEFKDMEQPASSHVEQNNTRQSESIGTDDCAAADLCDDDDDSELLSSGVELTPTKEKSPSTTTSQWLEKARSKMKVPQSAMKNKHSSVAPAELPQTIQTEINSLPNENINLTDAHVSTKNVHDAKTTSACSQNEEAKTSHTIDDNSTDASLCSLEPGDSNQTSPVHQTNNTKSQHTMAYINDTSVQQHVHQHKADSISADGKMTYVSKEGLYLAQHNTSLLVNQTPAQQVQSQVNRTQNVETDQTQHVHATKTHSASKEINQFQPQLNPIIQELQQMQPQIKDGLPHSQQHVHEKKQREPQLCNLDSSNHTANSQETPERVSLSSKNVGMIPMFNPLTMKLLDKNMCHKNQNANSDFTGIPFASSTSPEIPVVISDSAHTSQASTSQAQNASSPNLNLSPALGQIEMPGVHEPATPPSGNTQYRESVSTQTVSRRITNENETFSTALATEEQRRHLLHQLLELYNIQTGDPGLDLILFGRICVHRGLTTVNQDVLRMYRERSAAATNQPQSRSSSNKQPTP